MNTLIFSATLSKVFLIQRRIHPDIVINIKMFSYKVKVFLSHFNKNWISWEIFEKSSKTKFHKNPSSESRVDRCVPTDARSWVDFRNFRNVPNNHTQLTVLWAFQQKRVNANSNNFPKIMFVPFWRLLYLNFRTKTGKLCTKWRPNYFNKNAPHRRVK